MPLETLKPEPLKPDTLNSYQLGTKLASSPAQVYLQAKLLGQECAPGASAHELFMGGSNLTNQALRLFRGLQVTRVAFVHVMVVASMLKKLSMPTHRLH